MTLRRLLAPAAKWAPPRVAEVRAGSPCAGIVEGGDLLLELDGSMPRDILDYMETAEKRRCKLRLEREGKEIGCTVKKEAGVPLGLVFEEAVFDAVRTCRNRCIFCFVDQMPEGLRPSLYLKDDDYRLSFYYGNFVTLNNLARGDLERIRRLRLSPLYVSLHSTRPELRSWLMGGNGDRGLQALRRLLRDGLQIHLQVVLCPGINDGEELRRTLADVLEAYPAASLAVVPVGLTAHARGPARELVPHDRHSSLRVLAAVEEYQELASERYGRRLFFAADEFFLIAGRAFPAEEEYDGFPQLENGVGMARKFIEEARREAASWRGAVPVRGVLTGRAGERVIGEILAECGFNGVEVVAAENRVLGSSVTVTALLSGRDIVEALRARPPSARELLVPESMLREGRFLDGLTPDDVERDTGYRLVAVEVDGARFLRALCGEGEG